jgi:hypothetical protein
MKTRTLVIAVTVLILATGSAFAQMGGPMPGPMPGPGPGHMGGGMGYGMNGAGSMISQMMSNTISEGYLDGLNPIDTPNEARAAVQAFIDASNSSLQISELWEYGTVYKAKLMDTKGAMAFDLIADKFTGAVMPEMGMSMMLNASYGKGMYKTPAFGKNLTVTPAQATINAQTFMTNNGLGYTLGTPEIYPGYYKFHTTQGSSLGMDIMVNGYNGGVWMNTFLGLPVNKF